MYFSLELQPPVQTIQMHLKFIDGSFLELAITKSCAHFDVVGLFSQTSHVFINKLGFPCCPVEPPSYLQLLLSWVARCPHKVMTCCVLLLTSHWHFTECTRPTGSAKCTKQATLPSQNATCAHYASQLSLSFRLCKELRAELPEEEFLRAAWTKGSKRSPFGDSPGCDA